MSNFKLLIHILFRYRCLFKSCYNRRSAICFFLSTREFLLKLFLCNFATCCLSKAACFEVMHVRANNALMRSSCSRFLFSCTISRVSRSLFICSCVDNLSSKSASLSVNSPITELKFSVLSGINAKHERGTEERNQVKSINIIEQGK